jgi:hypothetical protein
LILHKKPYANAKQIGTQLLEKNKVFQKYSGKSNENREIRVTIAVKRL